MEIVYLNIHHLSEDQPASRFLAERAGKTDILCIQEAPKTMDTIAGTLMQGFCCEMAEKEKLIGNPYRLGLLAQAQLRVVRNEVLLLDDQESGLATATTLVDSQSGEKILTVGNVHGVPYPRDKQDCVSRLRQSRDVLDWFEKVHGPRIIGGDFNLNPDTKSVQMFEEAGYVNLIKQFGIDTTRNELAWRNWPGQEQMYADYLFASPEIEVQSFFVPKIDISDHLPLILNFKIH